MMERQEVKNRKKINWSLWRRRVALPVAMVVVFVTTYSLILPAITMENQTYCGIEEHQHTDACYTVETVYTCGLEESEEHTHTDECVSEVRTLTCGLEEHVHAAECFVDPNAAAEEVTETAEAAEATETAEVGEATAEAEVSGEALVAETENNAGEAADAQTAEDAPAENADAAAVETAADEAEVPLAGSSFFDVTLGEAAPEVTAPVPTDVAFEQILEPESNERKVIVNVDCTAAAGIPADAVLEVKEYFDTDPEYGALVAATEGELCRNGREMLWGRYFDFTIRDAAGNELALQAPVKVKVVWDAFAEHEIHAVSLDAVQPAEVELTAKDNTVRFDADGFTAFAVAEMKADELPAEEAVVVEETPAEEPAAVTEETTEVAENPYVEPGKTLIPVPEFEMSETELTEEGEVFFMVDEEEKTVVGADVTLRKVLVSDGQNVTVTVDCKAEAGVPEDAQLEIREIKQTESVYDDYLNDAKDTLGVKEEEITYVRFFDITILDADGNEIQPAIPVDVKIVLGDKTETTNEENAPQVLHYAQEKTEVVESTTEGDTVTFEADGFSVWGIVETGTVTVDYLTSDGSTYEITVDLTGVTNIPQDASLDIRELVGTEYDQYLASAAAKLGVDVDSIAKAKLFDITIKNDSEEIQPNGTVKVDVKLKDEAFEKAAVVHFGEETEVLYAEVEEDVVSFETTGFSIYAIVESDGLPQPPRVTFEFSDPNNPNFTFIDKAGHEQTTQIIKNGEVLQDVGLPTIPEGEKFNGWFIYNGDNPVEAISFDSAIAVAYGEAGAGSTISASSITIDPNDLNEDGTYHVQVKAFFGEVVYLTFYEDAAGTNILNRIQIAKGSEYNIATQTVTAPNSELAFQGWNETAGENDDTREAITSTTMTFNADDSFYPIFKSGHWITFYAGATGSGADYTAPVFVIAGDTASGAQPSNPEWKGYAFQYWTETNIYTGENGSYVQPTTAPTRFNFNSEINEAKTLYAYWTPADTTYTVVFWKQNVTDNKNASSTNSQTYTFAEQITENGTTGTIVAASDYVGRYSGFDLNTTRSDSSVVVNADGTSIINIYFDRQLITLKFYRNGNNTGAPGYDSNYYNTTTGNTRVTVYTGLYGQTLAQNNYEWPDGEWSFYTTNSTAGMSYLGQFVFPMTNTGGRVVRDTANQEMRLYFTGAGASDIRYYIQDANNPNNYTLADTGKGSGGTFNFSEKFDGFEIYQYRRLNHNTTTVYQSWTNAAVGGTTPTSHTTGWGWNQQTVYEDLEIRYNRKTYNLKYLDSVDNTELSGITTQRVVYGANLASYEPASTFIPVSQYPGKVWDGKWYKDQACSEEFDWSITMPNADMVVYAGWEDVYYKVDIDPNGGTLTEGESTLFWRTYGQTVQRYDDVVRDYAEDPDGNYKYEDFLRSKYEAAGYDPWDYDGYLRTARYVSSDTTTTVPMVPYGETEATGTFTYPYESTRYAYEKGAYALIGWYELTFADGHYGDLNYVTGESLYNFGTGVTHDTYIQAKWRRVGEYHVEYKPNVYLMDVDGNINTSDSGIETTNLPSDGFSYADQSQSSIMRSPDSPITRTVEGESKQYVFQGWYYNGQLYTPGDVFTVLSSLAEDKVIGHDDEHDADIIQKTVYIYPVYQSVDDLPVDVTHIYWYSNWQDTDGNVIPGRTEENQLKDETNNQLQPNEAVDIDYIDKLLNGSNAYDGYTFLGWAKSPTARTPWLTYNSETGKFSTVKDGVTYDNVTQVAADEVLPYEDLFAVWEINKYTVTVTKTVAGTGADQHRGFTFAPVFTGYSGGSNFILAGEQTTVTDEDTGTTYTYNTSKEFTEVPYGATLTLTENQEDEYVTTVKYSVTSNVDGTAIENPEEVSGTNGATYTIQGDITIAYTNTLKTTTVTVKKSLENQYINSQTGQDFSFTATYAGADPITFTVNSNDTDGYTIENVPVGVEMVISEAADEAYAYTVTTAGTNSEDTDEVANTYTFQVPANGDTVTFTNTVVTVNGVNVTKTDDKTPATGLSGADFTLTRNTKLDGTGSYTTIPGDFSGTLTSGANGVLISAGTLPVGYYKLTEDKSPDGYIITNNEVTFKVSEETEGVKLISEVSGENASVSDDGKTLTITNQTGQALPHTGGHGTLLYTLSGIALMLSAAMMYGFRMRRRERRLTRR